MSMKYEEVVKMLEDGSGPSTHWFGCENSHWKCAVLMVLREEHEDAEKVRAACRIVDRQADDDGLWFVAEYASEAYLQAALRELHEAIETGYVAPRGEQ